MLPLSPSATEPAPDAACLLAAPPAPMTPTAVYLALFALLLVGFAFGATLLNVPPLWTAAIVLVAIAAALAVASARPRRPGT